ncbi:MAG: phosphate-starvation-inducible rane protein PsiE [Ilumatobacteraceae bacterium]|nr:phosphate-starvation-inducible rane protein PsiE [Ilumatobacteraceae bacterium]MCU1390827.1 phosphate-starvation-inducible rane protein PsiE [Ilumatobacteraceae bacterium]
MPLHVLHLAEDVIHYLVAIAMVGLAGYVLVRSVIDFTHDQEYSDRVIGGINGVLFVVIVLELLTTVLAHFHDEGFQLTPFLIIGGISAVRHILTIGAKESLGDESSQSQFNHAQIGLAINAGVTLVMVIALVLMHRSGAEAKGKSH